jgi:hypothetical protein
MDPDRAGEPLTYYHRTGPIGQAFATFTNQFAKRQVGVIGLGAGSLAAYANAGDRWTFYEIDPTIEAMARDPRYFTFLRDSRGDIRVIVGDARLSLTKETDQAFDLLVVDAFGSDAIPLHLLTREALEVYMRKLRAHGVLAFHLSNRYMDLQPLVGDLAHDAGFVALAQSDKDLTADEARQGKAPSTWVLVARAPDDFGPLNDDRRWQLIPPRFKPIVWTDDFSNPLAIVRWR